jgi:hypothetical protein
MTTLNEYRKTFYEVSGKASDVCRQLAFAAIAIIWLFKRDTGSGLAIPSELIFPGVLVVAALGLDLLQYCWSAVTWYFFYRSLEERGVAETEEVRHSVWLERPISLIFWIKVALVIATYCFILAFLLRALGLGLSKLSTETFEVVDIAAPIVLVLMGVAASWLATTRLQRGGWAVGFAVVGLVAVIAGIQHRKQIRVENLGGDQFFAVSFLYGAKIDIGEKVPLAVSNSGESPIYDATFVITKDGDFFQNGLEVKVGTIYAHEVLRRVSASLPVGSYIVEIHTKNGWFFEKLVLTEEAGGSPHQAYYVRRIGSDQRLMNVQ